MTKARRLLVALGLSCVLSTFMACGDTPLPDDSVDSDGDGYSPAQGDCDDADPGVRPGGTEAPYNGKDDDCNKLTPDDDLDGDGFAKRGGGDCNDNDKRVFPGATEIPYDGIDQDCSGKDLADVDKDGYDSNKVSGGKDCDDNNPYVHPGGKEVCGNGVDEDCSGYDLGCDTVDRDGDGYSPAQGDCNDNDKTVSPGVKETAYNGKDDDCNKLTPDDDLDSDGYNKVGGGDCNDNDKTIHPNASEVAYDGIDQDCKDGDLTDVDKDGYSSTQVSGGTDCNDNNASINPGAQEIPFDTTDQNCDGSDYVTTGAFDIYVPSGQIYANPYVEVAYNGTDYLVVWLEYTSGPTTTFYIRGQRVSSTGSKVGGAFLIEEVPTYQPSDPTVASDGTDYVVAWRVYDGAQHRVYAQRVSASGYLSGSPVNLRNTSFSVYTPVAVAYNNSTYGVTWREYDSPATTYYVYLQRMSTTGALIGVPTVIASAISAYPLNGQTVDSASKSSFLVTWYRASTIGYDIFGRLFTSAGIFASGEITISDNTSSQYNPASASDGTNFLAVWRDARSGSYDVYGQLLSSTGSLVGGTTSSQNLAISTAVNSQDYPDVAYCNGRYTVVFKDSRYTAGTVVFKQPVGTDGLLKDASATVNVLIYANTSYIYYPRLACGGTKLLVVIPESSSPSCKFVGVLTDG